MVEQFGFAMIFLVVNALTASALTSGTTKGTSGSMRKCEVLSITVHPAAAAFGANSAETFAPGENNAKSHPLKSNVSSA
jgi:hypothetical protein